MKIISNEKLIKRNAKIAQYTGLAGLLVIIGSIYMFFTQPQQFALVWGAVLLGFILSQIGIYFTNRWGRRPRPDEHLTMALKGLDNNYTLYHYTAPTPHLMVGPAGVWVLLPRYQKGIITYQKGRWRQRGGGFMVNYMKIFGQEGLGRPDLEIAAEVESVQNFFQKKLPDLEIPPIHAALVFTDENVQITAEEAPTPTIQVKKLKEMIRKKAKSKALSVDRARLIQQALESEISTVKKVETEAE